MLLSLVYEERKEEVMDKLIKFIHQLSVENMEVAVKTLNKPIHFIKGGKRKQLIFLVIIIRLDNNS